MHIWNISYRYGWNNTYFQDSVNINKFRVEYEKTIKKLGLSESRQEDPIDYETAIKILKFCNQKI